MNDPAFGEIDIFPISLRVCFYVERSMGFAASDYLLTVQCIPEYVYIYIHS